MYLDAEDTSDFKWSKNVERVEQAQLNEAGYSQGLTFVAVVFVIPVIFLFSSQAGGDNLKRTGQRVIRQVHL